MAKIFIDSKIMLRFGETKVAKVRIFSAKKPISISDVITDNIVSQSQLKQKNNCKYLIRYLEQVVTPLVFTLPEMIGYIKAFWVKHKSN